MNSSARSDATDHSDRIGGKGLLALFERLRQDRTPLQLTVLGKGYERLSLVTGVKRGKTETFLLIDCPQRFEEEIQDYRGITIKVEFLDADRIQYAFRSSVFKVSGEDIWLVFPEFVERIQRRRHFRIAPPLGTRLSFIREGKPLESAVINLSEGGALISLNEPAQEGPRFFVGDEIGSLHLRCLGERVSAELRIRRAAVRRVDKNQQTGRPIFALQFLDMEGKEMNALHEFIFRCQRDVLERRHLIEEN